MSTFGQLTITNKGLALIAKAESGANMRFTRMAIGDGELGATDPMTLSDLVHRLQWVVLNSIIRNGSKVTASGTFNNQGAVSAFYYREIGLYAQDPDDGEILFMYGNAGETSDEIPAQGSQIIERTVNITTVLSTEITLTVELDSGAYVLASAFTAENLLSMLKTVDGSGSGLDADTLRGLQPKSDGTVDAHLVASTATGLVSVSKIKVGPGAEIPAIYVQTNEPVGAPTGSLWIKPKT